MFAKTTNLWGMNFKWFSLPNRGMQSLQCTMLWLDCCSLVTTNLLWDHFLNYENPYVPFELCLSYNCQMKFLVQIICFFSHQMLAPSFDSTHLLLSCFPTLHKHQGVIYDFLIPFSTKVVYNLKSCISKFPKHHYAPLWATLCALAKCCCFSP